MIRSAWMFVAFLCLLLFTTGRHFSLQVDSMYPQGSKKTLRILIIGDSNTEIGNITIPLKSLMDSLYGDYGTGYCTLNTNSMGRVPDNLWVECDTNWIRFDMRNDVVPEPPPYYSPDGLSISSNIAGAEISVHFQGEGIDLYYLNQPEGGTFSVTMDGIDKGSIKQKGSIPAAEKKSYKNLAPGAHVMILKAISGNVSLLGVDARKKNMKDSHRFILHKWGNGWASTKEFTEIDKNVFCTSLKKLNPDHVVILLGTNDHNLDHREADDVKKNLLEIISRIQQALPSSRVLIVSTFTTNTKEARELLPAYVDHSFPGAANETHSLYWNMNAWFGPYDPGKLPDGIHASETVGEKIAIELLHQLFYQ
jgi:hypothetical protein